MRVRNFSLLIINETMDHTYNSPGEGLNLEQNVQDSFAPVQKNSNRYLYLARLQAEREQLKQNYRAESAKIYNWEQKQELLSQHRSALAKNQYQMGLALAMERKTFSDIPLTYGRDPALSLKVQQSIALLETSNYSDELVAEAKKRLRHLKNRGLHHQGHQLHELYAKFEQAINSKEESSEAEVEKLVHDHFVDSQRDPSSWTASEKYPLHHKKDDEKSYSLEALTKAYEVVPVAMKERHKNSPEIEASEIDGAEVAGLEEQKYAPSEERVVKKSFFKRKVVSAIAKAAVVVGGIAAFVGLGYHALRESNDAPTAEYHGQAAAEIINSNTEVKSAGKKILEARGAETEIQNIAVPVPIVAKAPQKSVVGLANDFYEKIDAELEKEKKFRNDFYGALDAEFKKEKKSHDAFYADIDAELEKEKRTHDNFYDELDAEWDKKHTYWWYVDDVYQLKSEVQKDDTIVGLWKDYSARGGQHSFTEYLNEIKSQNPQLKNPDKIKVGETLDGVPSPD